MRRILGHVLSAALSATIAGAVKVSEAAPAMFVYVGNADSNDVYAFRLDQDSGDLALIERVLIPGVTTPGTSTPMAVSPDRRFLYVGTRGEPRIVATFSIDSSTGRLRHVGNGPLPDSMAYISTDRTGHVLFGASYPGHSLTVSPIGSTGIVGPVRQILSNHTNAHAIRADESNRYAIATTLGNDLVNVFGFDAATGRLTPHAPPSVHLKDGAGPRHFVFHPNGKIVYVLGELDGAIHVFDYDAAKGLLEERSSVSTLPPGFSGKPAAADVHITPNGSFVYSSERTSSTVTGFTVDPKSGALAPIESVPTESSPRGFSIDPSGRYLLVVGQTSDRMSSYRIAPGTGRLTKLKDYPMGSNPNWIEVVGF